MMFIDIQYITEIPSKFDRDLPVVSLGLSRNQKVYRM